MKPRTRRARFRATVKDQEWTFVWEPKTRCLCASKKYSRKKRTIIVTAEHLVELMQGQLMLL